MGVLVNGGLMFSLGRDNWIRLVVWLIVGLLIYLGYSRHHSVLSRRTALAGRAESDRRTGGRRPGLARLIDRSRRRMRRSKPSETIAMTLRCHPIGRMLVAGLLCPARVGNRRGSAKRRIASRRDPTQLVTLGAGQSRRVPAGRPRRRARRSACC